MAAQLDGLRLFVGYPSGLYQFLRSRLFTLNADGLRASGALRFSLSCDRTNHVFVQLHVFDLDVRNLDAQGVRLLIENGPYIVVQPLPFGQHLIEFVLAQYRAQRGLHQFAGGLHEILHVNAYQGAAQTLEGQSGNSRLSARTPSAPINSGAHAIGWCSIATTNTNRRGRSLWLQRRMVRYSDEGWCGDASRRASNTT